MSHLQLGTQCLDFLNNLIKGYDCIQVTEHSNKNISLKQALDQFGSLLLSCFKNNKKLIFIGNGGSAAIASHQAVDFLKNGKLRAIAFNDASLLTCLSNDYGYDRVFSEPIKYFAQAEDILIAISSSGKSKNIIEAVKTAQQMNCSILTFSGFDAFNPLRLSGKLNFYVPSFNYGIVEILHLSILHSILDSFMTLSSEDKINDK